MLFECLLSYRRIFSYNYIYIPILLQLRIYMTTYTIIIKLKAILYFKNSIGTYIVNSKYLITIWI